MSEETNSPSYAHAIVQESSGNPAWETALSDIPEEYHQALTGHFKNWDTGVNERFSKIHEEYKPFKNFRDNGYDADQIDFALGVIQKLEADPLSIYRPLHEHLSSQGLLELGQEDYEDDAEYTEVSYDDPRINQLQDQWQTLTEAFLAQQQSVAEAEEDAILESELADMRQQYGDFNEEFVLEKMYTTGMDTEDAVKSYFQFVDSLLQNNNRPNPPRILGSAGAFPGQGQVDPTKLQGRSRIDLVADILNAQRYS